MTNDSDVFPFDPLEIADSDKDGVGDNSDPFPNDATESVDSDLDGVGDNADQHPQHAASWSTPKWQMTDYVDNDTPKWHKQILENETYSIIATAHADIDNDDMDLIAIEDFEIVLYENQGRNKKTT